MCFKPKPPTVYNMPDPSSFDSPKKEIKKKHDDGHYFLGCICDMRRAVIILDSLGALGSVIALLVAVILYDQYGIQEEGKEEERIVMWVDGSYNIWTLCCIHILVIYSHLSGIIGAVTFRICPLVIAMLIEIGYGILAGLDQNWISLGVCIFLLYPHISLCHDLSRGILTNENSHGEEQKHLSCWYV
ncbi:expressed unknown protein [Seminavis robusta]|uniref:Uncharacterized protein n=1 Tax=Seminavis robusta TaxID=568900 RepID=A0A9N8DSX9_9STRA|nr:expressed unknown protein [Seminavis robusta]|eukprot:Sro255_g100430.1 n/a (187) ;mRNA; r:54962-55522